MSDSEEGDIEQIAEELRELQEVLGISFKSRKARRVSADPLSAKPEQEHAALAQEWEDIDNLLQHDVNRVAEGDARHGQQPGNAERNAAPECDPGLTVVEGQRVEVISHALAQNRMLQERLKAGLKSLDRASDRMSRLRTAIEDIKLRYKGTKPGTVHAQASGTSRFWSVGGRTPEANVDTKTLLSAYQYLPHTFGTFAWSDKENCALQQAVVTAVQEVMLNEQLESPSQTSHAAFSKVSQQLQELRPDSPAVRAAAGELDDTQWNKVAQLAGGKRSAQDCRCQWFRALAANRGPWSSEEHARMLQLANKHAFQNWPAIAKELGTGRHASDCLSQYQRGTAAAAPARKWDAAEDVRLQAAVKRHGRNWQAIASEVGSGRTAANCLQRWSRRGLGTALKKGRWDKEEDQALLQAVSVEGLKWSLVAKHVSGRSDVQCRERYMNVLDPSLTADPWNSDEDEKLRAAVNRNMSEDGSISWVGVAAEMPGRTDNHVSRRWKQFSKGLKPGQRARKSTAKGKGGGSTGPSGDSPAKQTKGSTRAIKNAPAKKAPAKRQKRQTIQDTVSDGGSHTE